MKTEINGTMISTMHFAECKDILQLAVKARKTAETMAKRYPLLGINPVSIKPKIINEGMATISFFTIYGEKIGDKIPWLVRLAMEKNGRTTVVLTYSKLEPYRQAIIQKYVPSIY